jgi:hypothetical protein
VSYQIDVYHFLPILLVGYASNVADDMQATKFLLGSPEDIHLQVKG